MIEVLSGRNPTYKYKKKLTKLGLVYTGTSWKTDADEMERRIRRFCNRKGLRCKRVDKEFVRSGDYRKKFFANDKGFRGDGTMYHCVYCGKRLSPEKVQVDHIIPVYGVQTRESSRRKLKRMGFEDVNDVGNLVASCKKCNEKKDRDEGMWVLRALIGRNIWFWRVIHIVELILVVALVIIFIALGISDRLFWGIRDIFY